jgi:hypothetical protein
MALLDGLDGQKKVPRLCYAFIIRLSWPLTTGFVSRQDVFAYFLHSAINAFTAVPKLG